MPTTQYEFRVEGRLSELAQHAVCDVAQPLRVESRVIELPPQTLIVYRLVDQMELCGIVAALEDLGLHVVSIHQVPG